MIKKRKRTHKSKYKHESTGDYCTCAAYVAEIMCKRNAEKKNKGSLPFKFWNKKPWNWTFIRQMNAANKLLKDYDEEVLVKAINSSEFRGIFSLNHPSAARIIKKYHLLFNEQSDKNQKIEVKKNAKHQKRQFGKQKMLNKLRNIENGQEEKL
jgi:hypothetical protein